MGAATADGIYGMISAFGITILSNFLIQYQDVFGLAGGLFLLYLGVTTLLSRPASEAAHVEDKPGLWGAYLSTLFLTLTNPITILFYAAIITSTSVGALDGLASVILVLGVFIGSATWWVMLTTGVTRLWKRLAEHRRMRLLLWANRLSGALIIAFAIGILLG